MAAKQELINYVANQTNLSKVNTNKVINALLEAITHYISQGDVVHLNNFGTFEVKKRAARLSHDVNSGKKIILSEQKVPIFKAGKALKIAAQQTNTPEEEAEPSFCLSTEESPKAFK